MVERSHKSKGLQKHRIRSYQDKVYPAAGQQKITTADSIALKPAGYGSLAKLEKRLAELDGKNL